MTAISVAMTTCNGERHLREQLQSLAVQTCLPFELHVGDDCSTDETLKILADFAAEAPFPVHVQRNPKRLGYGENFIQTALRCRGDWIAFCDQDDVWSADKLSWAREQIAAGPDDLVLLAHNATVTDEKLRPLTKLYNFPRGARTPPLGLPPEWFCIGATQVFRRDMISAIPPDRRVSFPWHRHRDAHDVWIALITNCVGTVLRTDRSLILYRRHLDTVTDQAKSSGSDERWRFQGANYRERADYLMDVGKFLAELAQQVRAPFAASLGEASQAINAHSALLAGRADALTAATLSGRFGALGRVIAAGGYSPRHRWSFGPARLVKDALGVLLAPRVKQET